MRLLAIPLLMLSTLPAHAVPLDALKPMAFQ